jgi:hypothetical protein
MTYSNLNYSKFNYSTVDYYSTILKKSRFTYSFIYSKLTY